MRNAISQRLDRFWSRYFPERRVFLKSDEDTRYIRLRPSTQALMVLITAGVLAWGIIATAILFMDNIGSGNFREQARRDQETYQNRLKYMATERDQKIAEANEAQSRFALALEQVSQMQSELLKSEVRRKELKRGIEVLQANLQTTLNAQKELQMQVEQTTGNEEGTTAPKADTSNATIDFMNAALLETAQERDALAEQAQEALNRVSEIEHELALIEQRNETIFRQIEEALTVSVKPLDKMFRAAGMNTDSLLKSVRKGYSGLGGPDLDFETMGLGRDPSAERAMGIIEQLDRMNLYRIAADRLPLAMPVRGSYRFTSGYGRRWGRMHQGSDFAAAHGTAIHATADGVVSHAGWGSGYGRLIKIKHDFGIETRYAHLSRIRVKVGQRVSRGQRIGDMGNTGRSTGTHLHYEVRVNGNAVNPMNYIKAGRDVF